MLFAFFCLLNACTEEIKESWANGTNIDIKVKGINIESCNGDSINSPAANAVIQIVHFDRETETSDTLVNASLDENGEFEFTIPDSEYGINGIKFIATYNSNVFADSIDFMCCDTTFTFNFNIDCDEIAKAELACESLDTIISLNLTNQYKGCLMLGASDAEIKWNTVSLASENPLTLDLSAINNLQDKFSVKISPEPENNEIILQEGTSVKIAFYVSTDEVGEFETQLMIPVTCTDTVGNTSEGEIEINVNAEVCEDNCTCPFASNGEINKTFNWTSDYVLVGDSREYTNQQAFEIGSSMLNENCYLQVTAINRYNTTSSAFSIDKNVDAIYDWTITEPTNFPQKISLGDAFYLSALFTPSQSGVSADTFEIAVNVFNQQDELKESCTFLTVFEGTGCVNICPRITINNSLSAVLCDNATLSIINPLAKDDLLDMDDQTLIQQSMSGLLGTLCHSWISGGSSASYEISLSDSEEVLSCSPIYLSFSLADVNNGTPGDYRNFDVYINKIKDTYESIIEGEEIDFSVSFNTPSLSEHISSGHGSTYSCKLIVTANDEDGNYVCSQNFVFEAEVKESTSKISEPQSMKAFSQISTKEAEPAYQVYKIDNFDDRYYYFGKVDNLSPGVGDINLFANPPVPLTNHSFYFEVDEPTNTTLAQEPKLYLVNSLGNNFSRITSEPVARYSSNSAFANGVDNLMEKIFNNSFQSTGVPTVTTFSFSSLGALTMWSPSSSAVDLAGAGNGINLSLGDVYIIWNPDAIPQSIGINGSTYSNYCDVALLYVDGISDGQGTNHGIGFVSFYVVYPLSMVKE